MYIETSIDIVIEVESIILLHYFNYSKHFCFPGESHNFWEMLFVDNGEVSISADGVNSTISAGYAVFHKPNEFHLDKRKLRKCSGYHLCLKQSCHAFF